MKAVIKILHGLFLVLCLVYLFYALAKEGGTIAGIFMQARLALILPAVVLWPACILVSAFFAWQILAGRECGVGYKKVLAIYLNRIPAKYLPGGVWQTFARAYDLNSLGLSKTDISILVLYENLWTVLIAAVFSSLMLLSRGTASIYRDAAVLILAGIVALLSAAVVLKKKVFILDYRSYLNITFSGVLFWLPASTSFILYLSSFDQAVSEHNVLDLIVNYLFSYVIGFISIFTPQGVGVFEFVMTQLTEFSISGSQALILLAGFRIVVLMGDMIAWSGFLVLNRMKKFE